MLPRVDTNIRPIAAIEAPTAVAIIGSAKQEIASRFDLLEIGKQIRGEILSRLSDGTFFVKLAESATARMALPANSKVGESIPLTLLTLTPRPTFLLESGHGNATTTATFSRIGSAKQEIAFRFDFLEIGKQIRGEILSRSSDGTFFVKLAESATAKMSLPANSKVGESIPLTLLTLTPRPTFLLESGHGNATTTAMFSRQDVIENFIRSTKAEPGSLSNNEATAEVSASYILETDQSSQTLGLTSKASVDTAGNIPSEQRQIAPILQNKEIVDTNSKLIEQQEPNTSSTPTNFSDAGKLINKILLQAQQQGAPSALIGKTPLLSNAEELKHPDLLAHKLQQTLSSSGIFYEAHVAKWAEGTLSRADLMREPQAQLGNATTNIANATTEDQSNLAQIIHLQLDTLEQQKIAWQGHLLPDLPFHWSITQQDQHTPTPTTTTEPEPSWQSVVRFELPNLGVVAATINFHSGQLQLFLSTDSEETVSKLKEHSFDLSQALEAAGAPIKSLLVKRDEQA